MAARRESRRLSSVAAISASDARKTRLLAYICVRAHTCAPVVRGARDIMSNDLMMYMNANSSRESFLREEGRECTNTRTRYAWVAKLVGIKVSRRFVGLLKYEPPRRRVRVSPAAAIRDTSRPVDSPIAGARDTNRSNT